ncbi:MAG: class B sortase, partial [Lawsonibacter sp.]|nr:class B sortase [Lawsonibacter sp.]
FGTLHEYKELSYWAAHPYVYLTDQNGSSAYEVFAAYEVRVDGDTYRLNFSSGQGKQNFIDFCLAQSLIDTGVVPSVNDRILTLSTCTGNGHTTRWVVQAVLKDAAPSDLAQQATSEASSTGGDISSQSPSASPDSSGANPSDASEQAPVSQDIRPEDQSDISAAAGDASAQIVSSDSGNGETVPLSP